MCGLKLLEIDEDSVGVCTSRARSDKCMEVFNRQGVCVACASLNPARKEKKIGLEVGSLGVLMVVIYGLLL
jgi:hypothetical protein